jgi:hypothetical protein
MSSEKNIMKASAATTPHQIGEEIKQLTLL